MAWLWRWKRPERGRLEKARRIATTAVLAYRAAKWGLQPVPPSHPELFEAWVVGDRMRKDLDPPEMR